MVTPSNSVTVTKSASDLSGTPIRDSRHLEASDSDSTVTLVPSDISTRHRAKPIRRLDNHDSLDEINLSNVFKISEADSGKLTGNNSNTDIVSHKRNLSKDLDDGNTSKKIITEEFESVEEDYDSV